MKPADLMQLDEGEIHYFHHHVCGVSGRVHGRYFVSINKEPYEKQILTKRHFKICFQRESTCTTLEKQTVESFLNVKHVI